MSYVGWDSTSYGNLEKITAQRPRVSFSKRDIKSNDIPAQVNFVTSQSAIEHVPQDLRFFRPIHTAAKPDCRWIFQVHLFPSASCLALYRGHGVRQYTSRTVAKITAMFDAFSECALFHLGGRRCNTIHSQYITSPRLHGKRDRRECASVDYRRDVHAAILEDSGKAEEASFWALIINSHSDRPLVPLIRAARF